MFLLPMPLEKFMFLLPLKCLFLAFKREEMDGWMDGWMGYVCICDGWMDGWSGWLARVSPRLRRNEAPSQRQPTD